MFEVEASLPAAHSSFAAKTWRPTVAPGASTGALVFGSGSPRLRSGQGLRLR